MKLPPKGRVVAYGRVSSLEQEENQNAAEQQRDRLRAYGIDELYFDIVSGNSETRPQLTSMLDKVTAGDIGLIIATRWDRITRNEALYLNFKAILRRYNVRLHLLDQGEVDLSTASGELSADMQAIFAVHERRMLRERVMKGQNYRRKQKVAWTRAPFGYTIENDRYVLDRQPIICLLEQQPANYRDYAIDIDNPNQQVPEPLPGLSRSDIAKDAVETFQKTRRPRKTLAILYERYGVECKAFVETRKKSRSGSDPATSKTKRQRKRTNLVLSKELLLWSAGNSLIDWLKNPVLRGHTAYCKQSRAKGNIPPEQWIVHQDTHPDEQLITEEEFYDIESTLNANNRKIGAPDLKFNLTGLVYCDRCGHKMVLKRNSNKRYYGCRHSTLGCSNRKCVRVEALDEAIAVQLFSRAMQMNQEQASSPDQTFDSPELIALRQELSAIDHILSTLSIADTSDLKQARHKIQRKINQIMHRAEVLDFDRATAQEIMMHPQARDLGFWCTRTYRERELLYDKLVQRINVRDGEIDAIELTV